MLAPSLVLSAADRRTFKVPVRPSVKAYLERKLLLAPGQAFTLTKCGQVGRTLYLLLRNAEDDRKYGKWVKEFPDYLEVFVPDHMKFLNRCRFMTSQAIHDFNRQIENMMEEEVLTLMEHLEHLGLNPGVTATLDRFLSKYGLESDGQLFEALRRQYYRRKDSQKEAVR